MADDTRVVGAQPQSATEVREKFDDLDDDSDRVDDPNELASALGEIETRCKKANLKFERHQDLDDSPAMRVFMRAGRDERAVYVGSLERAERLLGQPFETFTVLLPYEAIASYETKTIWACAVAPTFGSRHETLWRALGAGKEPKARLESSDGSQKIEFGADVSPLLILSPSSHRKLGLRISGGAFANFDSALSQLVTLTDALFFDLDARTGIALSLQKDRLALRSGPRHRPRERTEGHLGFPRFKYDREPMSLYWYAREARGMPLLEFLAYYQCIEFYFPTYAEAEARKRVRNALKDPAFDLRNETHIARIVQILSARKGLGDERTQLRATLTECVDADVLRDFFKDKEQVEFFSKNKALDVKLLPLHAQGTTDLREAVADRIYDIRCKIVHTKGGDGTDLLLPFSKEANLLGWDIALVQFVARATLISGSRSL